jgi:hypothetical protein
MKFLKQKTLSRYIPNDNAFMVYDTRPRNVDGIVGSEHVTNGGRAVLDITGGLRLPKGSTLQRPELTTVRTPNGANGYIRYNTDTDSIEAYIAGGWQIVSAPGSTGILKQTLGPGDYVETIFGPLASVPPNDDSILVLVENVFQISNTNFNILYNYLGSGDAYIEFQSPVPLDKYITIYFGFNN